MSTAAPAWVARLADALVEALPRLYGSQASSAVAESIGDLAAALAEGRVETRLRPEQVAALADSPLTQGERSPLVLEGDRLLWRRWHSQRQSVLQQLSQRARATGGPEPAGLATLVERHGHGLDGEQRRAVAAVLLHRLVLLEGGPGTGKTSTVGRMLAAVREEQPDCRIQLAAPTGKAAARLRAAIAPLHPDLSCSTLHRLLESQGERFRRNRQHPLDLDLLVVDEVSMVDLGLMEALLDALPESARLVLVGDAAQLPPIAPGAVLLELQQPQQRQALGEAAVRLHTTYRNQGAIAAVAGWLRGRLDAGATAPDDALPREQLDQQLGSLDVGANLRWHRNSGRHLPQVLLERLRQHQHQLLEQCQGGNSASVDVARQLLALLDQCLVLSPVRQGPWGVEAIHRTLLGDAAARGPRHWPLGTPVLCGTNQDDLGLANGDVGMAVERHGERRLLFAPAGAAEPLWVHPAQLPGAQPALALTVHKAQGSEAEEVWVLLPEHDRAQDRLLYTALTRARQRAHLITPTLPERRTDG